MKKVSFLLFLTLMGLFVSAQTIEKVYYFDNPEITEIQGYNQIQFDDCMQTAIEGNPSLPYKAVSLLLPYGSEAYSVEVELSDFQEINLKSQLFPYQSSRPYSLPKRKAFVKNEDIYLSKSVYPAENHGVVTTQYMNGYSFAFTSFTPVQYEPSTGKVMYAQKATVRVKLTSSKEDRSSMLWGTATIRERVKAMADNPEMIESYNTRGREVPGYDMLIITDENFVDGFAEYTNYYDSIGVRNVIVTLNEIYNSTDGRDNQEKIRNYIIQEYTNNGIIMVLLGGDVNIVPYRGFYCDVLSGGDHMIDSNIPADLYFSALDGTWNDNNDNKWGEIGEDDLLPEVGIARMSFSDATKQANMINKSLRYQRSPVLGELRNVVLAGEWLYDNPVTYGSDYLELLIGERDDNGYTTIGIPEDYNFNRLYAEDGTWGPNYLKEAINSGVQYVHHVGHANTNYVAEWYNSTITDSYFSGSNGVDHNYTFFHSHGCICGSFEDDCIMERMISIQNFCVAAIGNSRYGWFNEGQTEGPAGHLHREMTDAQFHERIPFLGMTLTESKCQTAPFVNAPGQWEEGALRWNFYDLNVLGDVAVRPWLDEPFNPNIQYDAQLFIGVQSAEIVVQDENNNGQKGFRCSIYSSENELLGFAITDDNGLALLEFEGGLQAVGTLKLVVTGLNAFPQVLEVSAVPNNSAYVIIETFALNDEDGQIDYNESHTIDMTIQNAGSVNAENVTATLSCDKPDYITFTNSTIEIDALAANSNITLENAFSFVVCDSVPDKTNVKFILTCTDGTDTWESKYYSTIYAPDFALIEGIIDDSNGNDNGNVDPGETVTIHFTAQNTGHSDAQNVKFAVFCSAPEISFEQNEFVIENLAAGDTFTSDFVFTLDESTDTGVAYELIIATYVANYLVYDSYVFVVGNVVETFESGDFSAFDWQFNENPWIIDTSNPYEGTYCAKSAPISDNSTTSLIIELEVFSDTEISFARKVSSEFGWDAFYFYIDSQQKAEWYGEVSWDVESFVLTTGTHTLTWSYTKDGSVSSGEDCAWLDNICFPPTTIIEKVDFITEENIAIYPNPTKGIFSIELSDKQHDVTIYNSVGQVVYQAEDLSNNVGIELNDVNSGLYFINIRNSEMNVTKKLIIE